jgi:hypothetical protein
MRHRKRSAAITLVLAGAVSGCGEPVPQRDVYLSLAECQRDWPQGQACEPARDGHYSSSWFYGPSYYGRTWPSGAPRPSDNAIDAYRIDPRSTTLAGTTRPGSTTIRSGFGSSSHSSSG